MEILQFPGIKLAVYGISLARGSTVNLGDFAVDNPEGRHEAIEGCLILIETSRKAGQMVRMANLTFDPAAFDYFLVDDAAPQV